MSEEKDILEETANIVAEKVRKTRKNYHKKENHKQEEGTNFWSNVGFVAAGVALGVGAVWGYNELKDALSNSDITIIDGDGSVYNETARSFG